MVNLKIKHLEEHMDLSSYKYAPGSRRPYYFYDPVLSIRPYSSLMGWYDYNYNSTYLNAFKYSPLPSTDYSTYVNNKYNFFNNYSYYSYYKPELYRGSYLSPLGNSINNNKKINEKKTSYSDSKIARTNKRDILNDNLLYNDDLYFNNNNINGDIDKQYKKKDAQNKRATNKAQENYTAYDELINFDRNYIDTNRSINEQFENYLKSKQTNQNPNYSNNQSFNNQKIGNNFNKETYSVPNKNYNDFNDVYNYGNMNNDSNRTNRQQNANRNAQPKNSFSQINNYSDGETTADYYVKNGRLTEMKSANPLKTPTSNEYLYSLSKKEDEGIEYIVLETPMGILN